MQVILISVLSATVTYLNAYDPSGFGPSKEYLMIGIWLPDW